MCDRLPADLEAELPNLLPSGYCKTSEADYRYNCVAWAAEWDTEQWWESAGESGMFWPAPVPRGITPGHFIALFRYLGYAECDSSELEVGWEKIAIYGREGIFTHVARQLQAGRWASKLGWAEDIEHNSLSAFDNSFYGVVQQVMKRQIVPA